MKNQLKLILVLVAIFAFASNSFGQIIKCKTTSIAIKSYYEYSESWSEWSEWDDDQTLITLDIDNGNIKVADKEVQVYTIVTKLGESTDSKGDVINKWECTDESGQKCEIRLVTLNSESGRKQIHIDFSDMKWIYNVNLIN